MKKHLYFHSSNVNYARDLMKYDNFEPVYQYPLSEVKGASQNEYGRLKHACGDYIHLLLGCVRQKNCHWCGNVAMMKRIGPAEDLMEPCPFKRICYCMQCTHCQSRGPVIQVDAITEKDASIMDYTESFVKDRYEYRRMWDDGLINPYEKFEEE